jgi:hypothetical protein
MKMKATQVVTIDCLGSGFHFPNIRNNLVVTGPGATLQFDNCILHHFDFAEVHSAGAFSFSQKVADSFFGFGNTCAVRRLFVPCTDADAAYPQPCQTLRRKAGHGAAIAHNLACSRADNACHECM